MQGMQPHFLAKFFRQHLLDLGKFGWIWAKFGQKSEIWAKLKRSLGKSD